MAENLGSIRYDVEVNTAEMLKAEGVVNKSIATQVAAFDKADKAVREFEVSQKNLGRTINSMGQVLNSNGKIVEKATNQYRSLASTADSSFNNLNTQITKSAEGVKKGVHRNFGQAGIQVQQFVGQLQGGQSAMLALSQQSADLGIVLGAPLLGVFISLAAVLAGTLAPAIFGTVSNIEKLERAVEQTKAVMSVGANGIAEYTEEMKRLNTASESLAKIKIALAMTANAEALKAAKKESSSLREELFGFQEYAEDAAKRLTGLAENAGGIVDIASAMRQFNAAASDEEKLKALQTTEDLLLSLRKDGVFPTKALADYAEKFFTFSDGVRQAITNNKALRESMDDIATSAKDVEDKFQSTTQALNTEIIALKSGEKAALKYSLMLGGMNADQVDAILTLYDKKVALEADAEATKKATKETEDYKKSIDDVNSSLDDFFNKESSDSTKKEEQRKATLTTQVQSIGLTPLEQIEAQYTAEQKLLDEHKKVINDKEIDYVARSIELERQKQEAIRGLQKETNDFLSDAFGNLDTQIAGTMASVVLGAQDGESALKSLAATILTQVVGAIIQQGIASAIASATAATAQTAANATILATATPAAAAVSLATAGANSGPALAGIAAVSALAATIPSIVGGREFGGPVSNGSRYTVGEKGKPEFFKDNLGNLSMIPGKNGEVIPADKVGGNGGGMTVNISNNTPYEVFVTQDQAANIANVQIGKEAGKLQNGRGNMYNAMKAGGKGYSNNAKR